MMPGLLVIEMIRDSQGFYQLTLEPRYSEESGRQILVQEEVLGSGDHFDDDPGRARRTRASNQLPRERMHRLVIENNYRRPGI